MIIYICLLIIKYFHIKLVTIFIIRNIVYILFISWNQKFITTMSDEIDFSLYDQLPLDLKEEIQMKIGLNAQYGFWSSWMYKKDTRTLIVDVGKLHVNDYDGEQTHIILYFIEQGLVNTLILRTCLIKSHQFNGGPRIEWVEQLNREDYWYLENFIDNKKIRSKVVDNQSTDYITDYLDYQ